MYISHHLTLRIEPRVLPPPIRLKLCMNAIQIGMYFSTFSILFVYVVLEWQLEMKLFCRYIGGLSAGHVSYSLGRLKYIAIYRIHSAGSNIYRNISDAIDFKSNNNFHRSNLSIIFHFYFLLANQLEPPNNISQVIINQPLSCEHPWRKKSFVEPKAVLGSVKSSSWKFFNFRVSGENRRNIHFNKALRHSNEH